LERPITIDYGIKLKCEGTIQVPHTETA